MSTNPGSVLSEDRARDALAVAGAEWRRLIRRRLEPGGGRRRRLEGCVRREPEPGLGLGLQRWMDKKIQSSAKRNGTEQNNSRTLDVGRGASGAGALTTYLAEADSSSDCNCANMGIGTRGVRPTACIRRRPRKSE